jgi:integrase
MLLRMTILRRTKSQTWVARKAIPKDVQDDYARLHGHRWEAKTTFPATLLLREAKAKAADWLSAIEQRIEAIRASQRGERQSLSQKQLRALAGEWYKAFTSQHDENPGEPEQWDELFWLVIDRVEDFAPDHLIRQNPKRLDWILRDQEVRDGIRPALAKEAKLDQFLADKGLALTQKSYELFVDYVLEDYVAAVLQMERRAKGDYSQDARLDLFPAFTGSPLKSHKQGGLTPWALFEAWLDAKKPQRATIHRWRSVFLDLEEHFAGRDADAITTDQALAWAEGLVTTKRTARTVNGVWCNAANTVFGWGHKTRKLTSNPFAGIAVTQPRKVRTRETDGFTPAEISLILKAALTFSNIPARTSEAAKRWVPWLCAYTGARPGEITQLRGQDVKLQDGIRAIQITPDAGSVKTGKPRTVPLHEHLIAQGFLDFVRAKGDGPLFYNASTPLKATTVDPTNPARARSVKMLHHLGEWVRSIGVTDKAVRPNHAWRHTFKRRAARAKIEPTIRDAICGHSPRTVADQYETPTLDDMAEALAKFPRYGIA